MADPPHETHCPPEETVRPEAATMFARMRYFDASIFVNIMCAPFVVRVGLAQGLGEAFRFDLVKSLRARAATKTEPRN